MKMIDLLTVIFLAIGVVLAIATYFLIKRRLLVPAMFPRVLGIGSFVLAIVFMMMHSLLLRPSSEFAGYTLENCFGSGCFGIVGYISGRIFERRFRDR